MSQARLLLFAGFFAWGPLFGGVLGDSQEASTGPGPQPSPAGSRTRVVWAVGDGADGGVAAKAVARRIAGGTVDRLVYLGDVYETGTAEDFANHWRPVYGSLDRITLPTPGNHEWANRDRGYYPYWRRVRGKALPPYYSVGLAGWELLSLNSEVATGPGSSQYRWLQGRLRRSGTCRLAFWHRPRFSAGPHGDTTKMAPLWRALRGHARLILSGHDHDLQRLQPVDGMTQFVSGAGGKRLYGLRRDRRVAFGDGRHYGALRLVLARDGGRFAFVTSGGRVLESGGFRCRPLG